MTGAVLRGLKARAAIASPAPELRRARRQAIRGDRAWQHRLERYEHGDVLLARTASPRSSPHPSQSATRR